MNSSILVAISLEGTLKREAVMFYSSMEYGDIITKALQAFKIPPESLEEYLLFIPAIECYVRHYEHLTGGHLLILEGKGRRQANKTQFISAQSSSHRKSMTKEDQIIEITMNKEYESDSENEEKTSGKDQFFSKERLDHENKEKEENKPKISLDDLAKETFSDREELILFAREWAVENSFQLVLNTREQILKKENTKVTILQCNKKGCEFFVEFRSNKQTEDKYKLEKYYAKHDHELVLKHSALEFTPKIIKKLKELRFVTDDIKAITTEINKVFSKKFETSKVWYQLRKLKDFEFGNPTNDSNTLIKFLERDKNQRGTLFYKDVDQNDRLIHFAFMTNRMKNIANKFSDVIVIDGSHKTNRFGMPLMDIIAIDNLGKSCTIFIALLQSQKYEEFEWALDCFAKNLDNPPCVIFTDEEEALRKCTKFFRVCLILYSCPKDISKLNKLHVLMAR